MDEPITTTEYVVWAYRLLLGREPEDMAVVEDWPEIDRRTIVARFLASTEFREQNESLGSFVDGRADWFISELENGTRFWIRGNDRFVSRSVADGSHEPAKTAFVRRQVTRGMNVLDIGANIGWFTINMAMLVGSGGRVDAFEPREDIAHYLRRTVAENKLGNVVVHRCALADANGDGTIAFDEQDDNPGSTHLLVGEPPPGATTKEVALRRLDSMVWAGVDFIKIDVEGAEKLVLDGAEIVLSRDRPLILSGIREPLLRRTSRVSVADYLAYFAGIDYEIRKLLPNGRCGEYVTDEDVAVAGDSLSVACMPAEKAPDVLLR